MGDEDQNAFKEVKTAVVRALVLAETDYIQRFILDADASGDVVGQVRHRLLVMKETLYNSIPEFSLMRKRRFSITERQTLAVVIAITEFRTDIIRRLTMVRTDDITIVGLHGKFN